MSRPAILFPLFAPVTGINGVGPKLAKMLERLGVTKVRDLAWLAPLNFIDRRYRPTLREAVEGQVATITVQIERQTPPSRPGQPYRVLARDETGRIELALFNLPPEYVERLLQPGAVCVISGRLDSWQGRLQMANPDYVVPVDVAEERIPPVESVYPLTAGLTNKRLRTLVQEALARVPDLPEWCDPAFMQQERFPGWKEAVDRLHHPDSARELEPTHPVRRRLAYDELLANQLALGLIRQHNRARPGISRTGDGHLRAALLATLLFTPTACQTHAVTEIVADLESPTQMLRLLQGDVGSGKTLVALLAMLAVIEAGHQAALMVPTEILARQHLETLTRLCTHLPLTIALLTGREKGKTRAKILDDLQEGRIHLLIGTHALFQDEVTFHSLGLAVVDEQHRFGVHQRLALTRKGDAVDMLVMTATPIPRTLLLTAYGDMAVSKLTEKPPGRQPVTTRSVSLGRLDDVIAAVGRALATGQRVYWVCPLVEESEELDLAAATSRFTELQQHFGAAVVLAHGRQKAAEKDAAMEAFATGTASLLIATTVIEVGVDVPEATIMVIEHAERFGLAQLHQLRGRVGRGAGASSCLLLFGEPLGEVARARLTILRETEDGFRIAEEDLRLRGAGEVLGTKQSGLPEFHHADLLVHNDLLLAARDDTRLILERDPGLTTPRGQALRTLLHLHERQQAANLLRAG